MPKPLKACREEKDELQKPLSLCNLSGEYLPLSPRTRMIPDRSLPFKGSLFVPLCAFDRSGETCCFTMEKRGSARTNGPKDSLPAY